MNGKNLAYLFLILATVLTFATIGNTIATAVLYTRVSNLERGLDDLADLRDPNTHIYGKLESLTDRVFALELQKDLLMSSLSAVSEGRSVLEARVQGVKEKTFVLVTISSLDDNRIVSPASDKFTANLQESVTYHQKAGETEIGLYDKSGKVIATQSVFGEPGSLMVVWWSKTQPTNAPGALWQKVYASRWYPETGFAWGYQR